MATFRVTSESFQRTDTGPRFNGDAAQARRELVRIAAGLRTANGRGVIKGYLRLTDGANNQLTLGRNLLWSRSRANIAAKDLVADMVAKAYGDHPEVQQALTDYLAQSDQRIGTQSFVKLVQALDKLDKAADTEPQDPLIDANRAALHQMQAAQTARLHTDRLNLITKAAAPPIDIVQPAALLNSGAEHDQSATAKPQYLSAVKHAIDTDGVLREIKFGEAPADGDCALHTAALALNLPVNRQTVHDWVREDLYEGDPATVSQVAALIADDLKAGNPVEYRDVTAALIKTNPDTYLPRWQNLFLDRERIWGSLQHLQYILRRHNRPLNIFVVDMLNPTQIKFVEKHNEGCTGDAVNVVKLNTNPAQAALNFNARMRDLETGLDYQMVIDLSRRSPEQRLAALRTNQQFTLYARSQANASDLQSEDAWAQALGQDDEPAEDQNLAAKLSLAFNEIRDSLEAEAYEGNHWDQVTLH